MIISREKLIHYHKEKLQEYRMDAGLEKIPEKILNSNEELLFGFENTKLQQMKPSAKSQHLFQIIKQKALPILLLKQKQRRFIAKKFTCVINKNG